MVNQHVPYSSTLAAPAWFSIIPVTSGSKPSGFVSTSQLNACWNRARRPRQSVFCLDVIDSTRNEYRRDSPLRNPSEFSRYCDAASWHSTCFVKSAEFTCERHVGSTLLAPMSPLPSASFVLQTTGSTQGSIGYEEKNRTRRTH